MSQQTLTLEPAQIRQLWDIRDEIFEDKRNKKIQRAVRNAKKLGKPLDWNVWGIRTAVLEEAARLGLLSSKTTLNTYITLFEKTGPPQRRIARRYKGDVEPEVIDAFEKTKTWLKIKTRYWDIETKKLTPSGESVKKTAIELWEWKDNIDPDTWPVEWFLEAVTLPESLIEKSEKIKFRWYNPKKKTIKYRQLSNLRIIMEEAGYNPKIFKELATGKVMDEPEKLTWYLDDKEILKLVEAIDTVDTIIYFMIGFAGGARFEANMGLTKDNINIQLGGLTVRESKTGQTITKYFCPVQMDLILRYLEDFKIQGQLFKSRQGLYYKRLKEAGRKAGIWNYVYDVAHLSAKDKKNVTKAKDGRYREKTGQRRYLTQGKVTSTHLLKHTYVSQASIHLIDMEGIQRMTGTTLNVLSRWYLGSVDVKLKNLIQGVKEVKPWFNWITEDIHPHFIARYETILDEQVQVNGIRHKSEIKEKAKPDPEKYDWPSIYAMINSERTEPEEQALWERAYRLHEEGLSDKQIKKTLIGAQE